MGLIVLYNLDFFKLKQYWYSDSWNWSYVLYNNYFLL